MSYEPLQENFSEHIPTLVQREESTARKSRSNPLANVKSKMDLGESLSTHDLQMAHQHGDHGFYQQAHAYVHGGGMTKRRKQLGVDGDDKKQQEKKSEERTAEKLNDKKTDSLSETKSEEKNNASPTSKSEEQKETPKNSVLAKPAENKQEAISQLKTSRAVHDNKENAEAESMLPVKVKQEEGKPTVLQPKDEKKTFKSRTGLPTPTVPSKDSSLKKEPAEVDEKKKDDAKTVDKKQLEGDKQLEKKTTEKDQALEGDIETQGQKAEGEEKKANESDAEKAETQSPETGLGGGGAELATTEQQTSEEQEPIVAPEILEAMRTSIFAAAETEKQNVEAATAAQRDTFLQELTTQRETLKAEMSATRKGLSAHFGTEKQHVKSEATKQRKALDKNYAADKASLDKTLITKRAALNKEASTRSTDFLKYVKEQKAEPRKIATGEADRADGELNSAATQATQVGKNVAARYPGNEDSRPDQREAANEVAKGANEEIRKSKAPMRQDLLERADEFDGGFDNYTTDTLLQIETVRSQIDPMLDDLKKQSLQALDIQYKSAQDALKKHEAAALSTLQQQEKFAVSQNQQAEQNLLKKMVLTEQQTLAAIQEYSQQTQADIDMKAADAAERLQGEPGVEESTYQAFTDETIAGLAITGSESVAKTKEVTDAQKAALAAEQTQTIEQHKAAAATAQTKATDHVKTVKQGLAKVTTVYTTQAKLITDKSPIDMDSLINGAFIEVDKAILDRKGRLKSTNDKFKEELQPETDENIAGAKAPLTDDLNDRATEAAEEAGKSWWEAVLSAIGDIVVGLLKIVALAIILVALGLCSTIMGAILLIGLVMIAFTFLNSLYERCIVGGQGWAGLGYSLSDAFGVTGLVESISGKDSWTGRDLTSYQRTKRGTEGGINLLMILFGARASRGGMKGGGGGPKTGFFSRMKVKFETSKVNTKFQEFNTKLKDFGEFNRRDWGGGEIPKQSVRGNLYNKVATATRHYEVVAGKFFGAIDKGINKMFLEPIFGGVKKGWNTLTGTKTSAKTSSKSLGARGEYSGRDFNPENAGGPVRNLSYDKIRITEKGVAAVKEHLARFDADGWNLEAVKRLEEIAAGRLEPTVHDKRFYSHELRESVRYRQLGHKEGNPDGVWEDTHAATLEDYRLADYEQVNGQKQSTLYHPEIQKTDPNAFSMKEYEGVMNTKGSKNSGNDKLGARKDETGNTNENINEKGTGSEPSYMNEFQALDLDIGMPLEFGGPLMKRPGVDLYIFGRVKGARVSGGPKYAGTGDFIRRLKAGDVQGVILLDRPMPAEWKGQMDIPTMNKKYWDEINMPLVDEAIASGGDIRFIQDPRLPSNMKTDPPLGYQGPIKKLQTFLSMEYLYFVHKKGYVLLDNGLMVKGPKSETISTTTNDGANTTTGGDQVKNSGTKKLGAREENVENGKFEEGKTTTVKKVEVLYEGKNVPVYRGGNDFTLKAGEYKINLETGMVKTTHGVSLDVNAGTVSKFGGAYQIESIPDGLKIIQRGGRVEHFEIVPSYEMPVTEYQNLLNQIKTTPAE